MDDPRITFRTDALKRHVGGRAVKSVIKRVDPDLLEGGAGQLFDAIIGGGTGSGGTSGQTPSQGQEGRKSTNPPPRRAAAERDFSVAGSCHLVKD